MLRKSLLTVLAAAVVASGCGGSQQALPVAAALQAQSAEGLVELPREPVHANVTAFVMARCPFAAEALRSLVEVRQEMGGALNLSIEYVGFVDKDGKPDRSAGQAEVESALLQICSKMGGEASYFRFLDCLYRDDNWRILPNGWDECAESTGIDKSVLDLCAKSDQAEAELAGSYTRSAEIGVMSSPTIFIDGEPYMGGRSVEEMMTYLCYMAGDEETRPNACDEVREPTSVAATLLYDSRCDDQELCDVSEEVEILSGIVLGLEMAKLDYATDEGRRLYERIQKASEHRYLPLIVIDGAVAEEERAMELLGEYLVPFGDGFMLSPDWGWDPTAEICDNDVDDTGDGLVDCEDPGCSQILACREEIRGRLDLFIMSGCPYAADLLVVVDGFLDHFDRDRKQVDLRLQFIGEVDGDRLMSMHGDEEVSEDLRMICAQDLYGKRYGFMKYVSCRAKSYDSADWESCVPSSMNKKKITQCATGKRGKELLKQSFELAEGIGVRGSPTWLLNNRLPMDGRSLNEIVDGFCERNEKAACGKKRPPEPDVSGLTSGAQCD